MPTPRRDDEELPALPPLEGDDEPLGDDAGATELDDQPGGLDDAASELALDVEFDESEGALDEAGDPLDVGADDEGIVDDGLEGATDDVAFDDRSASNDLDIAPLAPDEDGGVEGPSGEVAEVGAPPPLDDDDDSAPRRTPAAQTALPFDALVAAACDGDRLLVAASEVLAVPLDPPDRSRAISLGAPAGIACAVASDGRGAVMVATLDGGVYARAGRGWRAVSDLPVRGLVGAAGVIWARARDGNLHVARECTTFEPVSAVRRAGAWAVDADGSLAVYDVVAREARRCDASGVWQTLTLPEGVAPARLAVAADSVACVDARGAAWRSEDRGATWARLREGGCADIAIVDGAALLACEGDGVARIERAEDGGARSFVASVRRGAERDGVAFVGASSRRAVVSVDGVVYVLRFDPSPRPRS